ncbi:MAG: hypothetical protein ABI675_17335 [Chitinophagaceae bacterium]
MDTVKKALDAFRSPHHLSPPAFAPASNVSIKISCIDRESFRAFTATSKIACSSWGVSMCCPAPKSHSPSTFPGKGCGLYGDTNNNEAEFKMNVSIAFAWVEKTVTDSCRVHSICASKRRDPVKKSIAFVYCSDLRMLSCNNEPGNDNRPTNKRI